MLFHKITYVGEICIYAKSYVCEQWHVQTHGSLLW
jgi:hypothetical protein